ncbi:MAG: hypothetical protein WC734_04220 [Patescibacteria group bacterium]|jgi:hypothetical protein
MTKEIWLFGNIDLPQDSLPLRLQERLSSEFPNIKFIVQDPLDEWVMPEQLYIIDTVQGLDKVTVFNSLDQFQKTPSVTMHDFDLGMQLRMLQKVGQLPKLTIFGVPSGAPEDDVLTQLIEAIRTLLGK